MNTLTILLSLVIPTIIYILNVYNHGKKDEGFIYIIYLTVFLYGIWVLGYIAGRS